MKVIPVPQLMDNYAYLVVDESTGEAGIVDCAEADPVLKTAKREQVKLTAVLPTHHHYDHVGGNQDLVAAATSPYGVDQHASRPPKQVRDGDHITLGSLDAQVIFIPAHTTGHIAYYFAGAKAVFTGDTLFAGGCGPPLERRRMMIKSLSKLSVLPDDTRVFFGHEYTEKNLRFALTLEPHNASLQAKHAWAEAQMKGGGITTPTTIAAEKETNPFLRWDSAELRATLHQRFPDLPMDDVSVFAKTRALKDQF